MGPCKICGLSILCNCDKPGEVLRTIYECGYTDKPGMRLQIAVNMNDGCTVYFKAEDGSEYIPNIGRKQRWYFNLYPNEGVPGAGTLHLGTSGCQDFVIGEWYEVIKTEPRNNEDRKNFRITTLRRIPSPTPIVPLTATQIQAEAWAYTNEQVKALQNGQQPGPPQLSLDTETQFYKFGDWAFRFKGIVYNKQTGQITRQPSLEDVMTGAAYRGVVVRNKVVAQGEGVTTGVVVSEIVYESDTSFVAPTDDIAKAYLLVQAKEANKDLNLLDPLAPLEVKLSKLA